MQAVYDVLSISARKPIFKKAETLTAAVM